MSPFIIGDGAHIGQKLVAQLLRLLLEVINKQLGSIKIDLKSERTIYRVGQTAFANIDLKNVGFSDAHVPIGTITAAAILQNGQSELDSRLLMFNRFDYSSWLNGRDYASR